LSYDIGNLLSFVSVKVEFPLVIDVCNEATTDCSFLFISGDDNINVCWLLVRTKYSAWFCWFCSIDFSYLLVNFNEFIIAGKSSIENIELSILFGNVQTRSDVSLKWFNF